MFIMVKNQSEKPWHTNIIKQKIVTREYAPGTFFKMRKY